MPFILDNSVAAAWLFDQQATPYGDAVALALQRDRAHAPALWELELTNVLRTACIRGRLQAQRAQAMLEQVLALPITIDREAVRPSEVLALALRHGLSSYDAAYLELALRLQLPIATQDDALAAAAVACGVGLWSA